MRTIEDILSDMENLLNEAHDIGYSVGYDDAKMALKCALPRQEEEKVKVGDEVVVNGYHRPVVVVQIIGEAIGSFPNIKVMNYLGDYSWSSASDLKKTGRSYPQLVEMLKQMKGEEGE